MHDDQTERCLRCDYIVTGIAGVCPECGTPLPTERLHLRYGRSPWALGASWWELPSGVWMALRHPQRTMTLCDVPGRVASAKSAAFALMVLGATVLLWPLIRCVGLCLSVTVSETGIARFGATWRDTVGQAALLPSYWLRLWKWEAWSLLRWVLLLGVMTAVLEVAARRARGNRADGLEGETRSVLAAAMRRVALLAPWIAVLELGYLAGVWLDDSRTVPEPSTIFGGALLDGWLRPTWLWRAVPAGVLVGLVFFRSVGGWRWGAASLGALLLIPLSIDWSIVWGRAWLKLVPWLL